MSLLSPTEELLASDTPPDEHRHYFRKKDLDAQLFEGISITALCGFVKDGLAHPDPPGLPVCEDCKAVWEQMKP